jgi:hypothetical protein
VTPSTILDDREAISSVPSSNILDVRDVVSWVAP